MERDRSFNFKLLVPPRVNNGQVSAVRPQEIVKNCGDFMNTLQQGYSKCFDTEQMPFPSTSMVAPYVSLLPIIVKIPQKNTNPGQLYSKLFDEVEKIKCWKVEVDTDTVQKERRLQENKRTIETQRKAIQELQFGNESLSVKLEEQMSENEDLRNKNNATRNLCNILKDTFQRSADKMHLFESEREETHHLFMENSESIQKLTAALESLRFQAEADQQEMHKVKEGLLQFDDLKEKYRQEYNLKEKEVAVLQTKLKDKESELQKILLDIHETQKHCKQLQEATSEIIIQFQDNISIALYKSCFFLFFVKQHSVFCQQCFTKVQELEERLFTEMKKNKEHTFEMEQLRKDIMQHDQLEIVINSLHKESENLKRLNEEDHQKLLKDLESKSIFAAELDNEVTYITLSTEAIKKKEDTELKCQHKIADMVALMEKHKSQYDRMVEEKDAELSENKKKEMEVVAYRKSLLDLLTHKNDNDQLKIQLKTQVTEKVCPWMVFSFLLKQLSIPIEFNICDFVYYCSVYNDSDIHSTLTNIDFSSKDIHDEDLKTPRRTTNRVGGTSKIKSYRIRTPPSDPAARWRESAIELDPKSDSSDQNDILSFTGAPAPNISAPRCKLNIFKKKQSPVTNKSPGNLLKLAAMKRMRDAGWTAVTGCDQKKKKTNEKIFA
uniref:Synaptonemal complex protein 1 n=1 Tax=Dicentrarchus labrax TaxID=13489 RepID=A0A8C4I682_DICLA